MRLIWLICGLACLGSGLVGAALPLLPTVPFLLLAAFCFARSSERLHDWLLSHPTFGPMIDNWHTSGVIRPGAKKAASVSIAAAFLLSVAFGAPLKVLIIQIVVLGAVTIFIWTRPSA